MTTNTIKYSPSTELFYKTDKGTLYRFIRKSREQSAKWTKSDFKNYNNRMCTWVDATDDQLEMIEHMLKEKELNDIDFVISD